MGGFFEFAEILEKKIRREIQQDLNFSHLSKEQSPQAPDLLKEARLSAKSVEGQMAWLIGQTPPLASNPRTKVTRGYPQAKKQPSPPAPRPPHKLDDRAAQALATLQSFGCDLGGNFNSQELKRAYRHAMLRCHPDRGGSAEQFQSARQAAKILEQILKPEPAPV